MSRQSGWILVAVALGGICGCVTHPRYPLLERLNGASTGAVQPRPSPGANGYEDSIPATAKDAASQTPAASVSINPYRNHESSGIPVPKSAQGEEAQEPPDGFRKLPSPEEMSIPTLSGDAKKAEIPFFPAPKAWSVPTAPPNDPLPGLDAFPQSKAPAASPIIQIQKTEVKRMDYPTVNTLRSREPLVDALQAILDNRHQEAIEFLKRYDPATQDLFLRLLPAVALLTKKKIEDLTPEEVAVLHEQLQSLMQTLRPRTKLTIAKACFCEWIKGFGNYKPLAEEHPFQASAGEKLGDRVQLYVELRNFSHEPIEGVFNTLLSTTVAIYDQQGTLKWRHSFDDGQQPIQSRTPMHDHHANYTFYVPPDLAPGDYRLLIRIEDKTRGGEQRVDEKILPFRITNMGLK